MWRYFVVPKMKELFLEQMDRVMEEAVPRKSTVLETTDCVCGRGRMIEERADYEAVLVEAEDLM